MRIKPSSEHVRSALYDAVFEDIATWDDPERILQRLVEAIHQDIGARANVRLTTQGLEPGQYRVTRLYTDDGVDHVDGSAWSINVESLPLHEGGPLAALVGSPGSKLALDIRLGPTPVWGPVLSPYKAAMVIRIHSRVHPGNWLLILGREPDAFTTEDLADAIQRTHIIGMGLDNLHISNKLQEASRWIQREIDQIGETQRALLPSDLSEIHGLDMAAYHTAFDRAGGDYFDVQAIDSNLEDARTPAYAVLVADVVGHGPSSTVVLALIHALFQSLCKSSIDPRDLLASLNNELCRRKLPVWMATAWVGYFYPEARLLIHSTAGHEKPILVRLKEPDSTLILDTPGGIPLGVNADEQFDQQTTSLAAGDTIILYTDGILDAVDPSGDRYGIERLRAALSSRAGSAAKTMEHILASLHGFQLGASPSDDQTVLIVRLPDDSRE